MPMPDVFAGLDVIEICSGYGPAVMAGKLLADIGCRVTKIEPQDGDPLRHDPVDEGSDLSLFSLVCGNKDCACLDLEGEDAASILQKICAQTGVLLLDAPAWRLISTHMGDARQIAEEFPGLTICVASYFGTTGPLAGWTGSEETVQALSGVMSTTGQAGEPPVRIPGAMITHGAAMFAVIAVLGDFIAKRGSGKGAFLDCNALLPAASFLTAAYPSYFLSGKAPSGIGNRHAMSAPWNTFPCSDGWLVICAGNEPSWRRLCTTMDRPDLLTDPRFATAETRVAHVEALEPEIAAWTGSRTVAEAERVIADSGTPCGAIVSLHDVLDDPQFRARTLLHLTDGDAVAGGIFHRDGQPLRTGPGRSSLGEATADFLARFGIDPARQRRQNPTLTRPAIGSIA